MEKFAKAGKAYRMGEYIVLPSWPKHQNWDTKDTIRQGIVKELNNLTDDELQYVYLSGYKFPIKDILIQRGIDTPTIPLSYIGNPTYSILSNLNLSEFNINSIGSAEKEAEATPPVVEKIKPKKPPLREREPNNDFEKVEKVYLQNWDILYSQKKVKTPDPVINWNQTRALLKKHFETIKPEMIIQAINNGMKDDFIMSGGYSLGTMLAATVLNRLINAGSGPPVSNGSKKTLSGLNSTF
jgi:hypothetical protein